MSTDAHTLPVAARPALNPDTWRQAVRITIGSVLGLALVKLMDWPFGVFFAVYPVLLLGLAPVFNRKIAFQFLGSSVASIAMVNVLLLLGSVSPVTSLVTFFAFAAWCFSLMARTPFFLFGAVTMVSTSVLVHLASHPLTPRSDLFSAQFIATLSAIFISALAHAFLPERRTIPMRLPDKTAPLVRHQILLGAICATASYIAFQVLDLRDSLSAQAATVLVLFPMTLAGGRMATWTRFVGTLFGSAYALAIQLVLYSNVSHLALLLPLYASAMLLFSAMHVRESAGPAVGFSAATAIAVLIGQLSPQADLYGVSLYRLGSVALASLLMLLCIFTTQTVLNHFPATRDGTSAAGRRSAAKSNPAP